jgi:hypothetical protein
MPHGPVRFRRANGTIIPLENDTLVALQGIFFSFSSGNQ